METRQKVLLPVSPNLIRRWIRGAGSALWNLIVLFLPAALLIQSVHFLQEVFFHRQGALYFHAYRDGDTRTACVLLILLIVFFQYQLLKKRLSPMVPHFVTQLALSGSGRPSVCTDPGFLHYGE